MGRIFAFALISAAMISFGTARATPQPAQGKTPTKAQENAYTLSLMCWVVAGYYENEADILRSADATRKMAAVMGYDNARIANDSSTMASVLGVELRSNPNAMEGHRASCRKIGLVS